MPGQTGYCQQLSTTMWAQPQIRISTKLPMSGRPSQRSVSQNFSSFRFHHRGSVRQNFSSFRFNHRGSVRQNFSSFWFQLFPKGPLQHPGQPPYHLQIRTQQHIALSTAVDTPDSSDLATKIQSIAKQLRQMMLSSGSRSSTTQATATTLPATAPFHPQVTKLSLGYLQHNTTGL